MMDRMDEIAAGYRTRGEDDEMVLQDFHTFRQALNVASGDQRLLVFIAAAQDQQDRVKDNLRPVFVDADVIGRFHVDFAGGQTDAEWADEIEKTKGKTGIFVIQSGQFGQTGTVLEQLPLTASGPEVKDALLKANAEFAKNEERKNYSDHVSQGRRQGVYFKNGMPYGEDRDGDGEIDHRGGASKAKGGGGAPKGDMKGKGKGPKGMKGKGKGKGGKGGPPAEEE
ncbi:MAG: hypothetical protein HKN23_08010, partial [Verrucomicrobiales bacterium]|nr:hypothetical protein [Verrucomicrobiales bacterium]